MKSTLAILAVIGMTTFATPNQAQAGGLFALGAGLSGAAIAGAVAAVVVVVGIVANQNDSDIATISTN